LYFRTIYCATINCRQSVVYAGDRRSNLVRHVPQILRNEAGAKIRAIGAAIALK
jgi:hypothetical protein